MSLAQPRTIFGIHSFTAFRRTNGLPYGMARVLSGSTFKLEGDIIELKGGSNRFSWAIEDGDVAAQMDFSMQEYPDWVFEVFGGKAPTTGSVEASGNVSAIVDKNGTTVVGATGLLATVTVSTAADLKTGKYVIKATGAAAFSLYALSNVDFGRGTDVDFTDDTLLVATVTGVGSGSTHAISGHGITFTAGASAGAMTTGDTATFDVRAVNTVNRVVKLGGLADVFPEFSAVAYAQKSGNGQVLELQIYKMKAIGMGLGAERKAFGQSEYSAKAAYDSVEDAICQIRDVE
jgi:hydrogenase maturation factor